MIYISSDTNVWIDFLTIEQLELPFRLPYTYLMYKEAIENELLNPSDFKSRLTNSGLIATELTIEEFFLADEYGAKYIKLSKYDRIALAIAKNRKIVLLTGDRALRHAAQQEGVAVMGTIALMDQLWYANLITDSEYEMYLKDLLAKNGKTIRLPAAELESRIRDLKTAKSKLRKYIMYSTNKLAEHNP